MFYCAFILLLIQFNLASGIFNGRSSSFVNRHREPAMGCPCEDTSLCGPIPPTKGNVRLAYSRIPFNWKYYDLSKLTEIVLFFDISMLDPEMVCAAHKNNVQLHLAGFFRPETFLNQFLQEKWISDHLKMVVDNNLDGINVDYEQNRNAELEPLIVRFMIELSVRLKSMNSNYTLTFCEPEEPRQYYDLATIPKIVDYLLLMSYDEVWDRSSGYRYPTANQNPGNTIEGISQYIQMGVPPSKLVVGMPWYGYVFNCTNITQEGQCILPNSTYIETEQTTFPKIYQEYVTKGDYNLQNGWDEASLTPFLTITSKDKNPPSIMRQFWYENATSLTSKSEMYKNFQLRGVGVFHVDCIDYTLPALECMVKPFWNSFSVFKD